MIARDVAEELGISEDSICRELRELAAAGHCQRVYGGAVPVSRVLVDYRPRASVEPESKARIAAPAVGLIESGMRVNLDGGSVDILVIGGPVDKHSAVACGAAAAESARAVNADLFLLGAVSADRVLGLDAISGVVTDGSADPERLGPSVQLLV